MSKSNSVLRARLWREHRDKVQNERPRLLPTNAISQERQVQALNKLIKKEEKKAMLLANKTQEQCDLVLKRLNDILSKQQEKQPQREIQRAVRKAERESQKAFKEAQRKKQRAVKEAQREKQRVVRKAQREKRRAVRKAERKS